MATEEAEYARAALQAGQHSRSTSHRGRAPRVLTNQEYLEFVEALPLYDSLRAFPDSAIAALDKWDASHPSQRDRWPAVEILRSVRWRAEEAGLRLGTSPFAGTFRVEVVFGTGQSTVLYLRTGSSPRSSIRGSDLRDLRRRLPISGYYLAGQLAASLDRLDSRDAWAGEYVGVALTPYSVTRDSSLWRGELDPLAAVSELESRPFVKTHAQSLFGPDEAFRDTTQFFTPGTWVLFHSGRLVYRYELRAGKTLLYSVKAERLSRN